MKEQSIDKKLLDAIFPEMKDFELVKVDDSEETLTLTFESGKKEDICPDCGARSSKHKTKYTRKVKTEMLNGRPCQLILIIHQFKCENPECNKGSFTENIPGIEKWQQRSKRTNKNLITDIIQEGFRGAQRGNSQKGNKIGYGSLHRLFSRVDLDENTNLEFIGIDDVSIKKGHNYRTAIYNGVTHGLEKLLEGRTEEDVKDYLSSLEKIEIVARDRGGAYATALKKANPDCRQVADRYHLTENLNMRATKYLKRKLPGTVVIKETEGGFEAKKELSRPKKNKTAKPNKISTQDYNGSDWKNPVSIEKIYKKNEIIKLFLLKPENRTNEIEQIIEALKLFCPESALADDLVVSFYQVFSSGNSENLNEFLNKYENGPFETFINGIRHDFEAVSNAVELKNISSGFVEGGNCKLKLFQRKGYGKYGTENLEKMLKLSHQLESVNYDISLKPTARKYFCVRKNRSKSADVAFEIAA